MSNKSKCHMRYGGGGGTKTAQQCDPFFHRALTHYPLDWRGFTGQKSSQIRTKQHVFDIFSTHIQTDAISGPRGRGFKSRHSDHVGASYASLAPTFFKVRARSRRCSSFPNCNRLRWVAIWVRCFAADLSRYGEISILTVPSNRSIHIGYSDFSVNNPVIVSKQSSSKRIF